MSALRKTLRYIGIYGLGRTMFKVAARTRRAPALVFRRHDPQDIGLIGCGQFGTATLGYFLSRRFGRRIRWVYDTNPTAARTAARLLAVPNVARGVDDILNDSQVRLVYVASNHASHSDYAARALAAGKDVYVEKPVAVSIAQLATLRVAMAKAGKRVFVGYNRPFSAAVRALHQTLGDRPDGPLSLNCCVSGHVIGPDHWYRKPEEGTRICGNAGHWIDLFVHMLAWRGLPDGFRITLLQADPAEPDDNFSLSLATDRGDIFSLMLTARSEPFEGINETVNAQQDDVICKIDDFRRMTVWKGERLRRWRFWPKDVGHRAAAMQPFGEGPARDWREIEASTLLMLRITDMVRDGTATTSFSLSDAITELDGTQKPA